MAKQRVILDKKKIEIIVNRLCHQLIENHQDFSNTVLISLLPRGKHIGKIICNKLEKIINKDIIYGELDISFYRDDLRNQLEPIIPHKMDMNLSVDNKDVVIIDDVLYTGRTIRAALEELNSFGRALKVKVAVLVDRGHRELPIKADFIGKNIPTHEGEHVNVFLLEIDNKECVTLIKN